MSIRRNWCDVCRGDCTPADVILKCSACPKRFHRDCIANKGTRKKKWMCATCADARPDDKSKKRRKLALKNRILAVKRAHRVP